jgi:hypothetical protein
MPLRHHQPPGIPRMVGDLSRRVAVLEREKNPAVSTAVAPFYTAVTNLKATRTLIGYWRLGEGASPYADTSGYGTSSAPLTKQAGTAAMTQDYTPGALPTADDDGAVAFNGPGTSAEYLSGFASTDTGRFNYGGGVSQTIAAWVKPFANAGTFLGGVCGSWNGTTTGWGYGLFVQWPTRTIVFKRRQGTSGTITELDGPVLTADQWSFVAATYSTTNGHRLYVNGSLVAADPATNTPNGGNLGWFVGQLGGSAAQSFYGGVDEVSAWQSELTGSEVASLSASGGLASSASAVLAVTGAFTASSASDVILATGTFTVTLPTAAGIAGKRITVKNTGSGTVTVGRTGTETIDAAAANVTMATAKQAREFTSDGTGWQITAAYL